MIRNSVSWLWRDSGWEEFFYVFTVEVHVVLFFSLAAMELNTRAAVSDNILDFYDLMILRNKADWTCWCRSASDIFRDAGFMNRVIAKNGNEKRTILPRQNRSIWRRMFIDRYEWAYFYIRSSHIFWRLNLQMIFASDEWSRAESSTHSKVEVPLSSYF